MPTEQNKPASTTSAPTQNALAPNPAASNTTKAPQTTNHLIEAYQDKCNTNPYQTAGDQLAHHEMCDAMAHLMGGNLSPEAKAAAEARLERAKSALSPSSNAPNAAPTIARLDEKMRASGQGSLPDTVRAFLSGGIAGAPSGTALEKEPTSHGLSPQARNGARGTSLP
jgi:hypothetical protein